MTATLRALGVGSMTFEPPFDPYVTEYECSITTTNALASGGVTADRRTGQTYTVSFGEGGTEDSGATIAKTTNIGQKTYSLKYGTGGEAIAEVPAGYTSGTTADIVLEIKVYMDGSVVNTYTVTVHRTYLVPEE